VTDNQNKPLFPPEEGETVQNNEEAFIPPWMLLGLSGVGFIVALIVALTQPTFGIIGYGGIAFGVLALIAWVLLAPSQAKGVLTGRTLRFGGTSLLVTILVIGALGALYVLARNQDVRIDWTESDAYSLSAESLQAMANYANDPTTPPVQILGFYSASQAGAQDRDSSLLDDYAVNSGGKLSYQFIDPERNPQQTALYGITRPGQIAVVAVNPDGTLDSENAVLVNNAIQGDLTNAVLRAAAQGEFIAYFITTRDGVGGQMTVLKDALTNRFDWTVVDASLAELSSPNYQYPLNDPNFDGQVIILPGGSAALTDQELGILQDYLANGGDLILYAGSNLNPDQTSLATSENLNAYLEETWGMRITPGVILDVTQAYQTPLLPVSTNLNTSAYITTAGVTRGQGALIFETPNSITLTTAPPNVVVTTLSSSTESAYEIADLGRIINAQSATDLAQTDDDTVGTFVFGAQAENAATGSRVVVFTSPSIGTDPYAVMNADNFPVAFNSVVWATDFNNFVSAITIPQQQRLQDVPLFASEQDLRNINFLTIIVLPVGILGIGAYVWWSNRKRGQAKA